MFSARNLICYGAELARMSVGSWGYNYDKPFNNCIFNNLTRYCIISSWSSVMILIRLVKLYQMMIMILLAKTIIFLSRFSWVLRKYISWVDFVLKVYKQYRSLNEDKWDPRYIYEDKSAWFSFQYKQYPGTLRRKSTNQINNTLSTSFCGSTK